MANDTEDLASAFRSNSREQLGIRGIVREYAEVERLAEDLREAERQVKAAQEVKQTQAEKLLYALQREGVRKYKYTDSEGKRFTIRATSKTTVSVKRGWEDEEGDA